MFVSLRSESHRCLAGYRLSRTFRIILLPM